MVTRIRHDVLDDLDGSEGATTRTFSVEGQHYEVDLTDDNWTEFQDAVKKFVEVSRKRGQKRPAAAERSSRSANPDNAKIRAWAVANGHEVPSRGRLPEALRQAYEKAQK